MAFIVALSRSRRCGMTMEWIRRLWPVWLFLAYFFVALALHHSAFTAPFYYDSANRLEQNRDAFDRGLAETVNIFRQRPVPMITFYLNYLTGGMVPRPFRICNAALLAAAGVALVILIGLLLEASGTAGETDHKRMHGVAVALGLIFVVHPIQTYVVVYVWQRMALLAFLFMTASLGAYVAARSRRPALGYSWSALFFLLALGSKETSVVLPLIVLLAETAFFPNTLKTFAARAAICLAVTAAFVGGLSFLESPHGLQESSGIAATLSRYYRESRLTVPEVLLTQCRVLFSYLEMILVPFPSTVRLFSPQVVSSSLLSPPVTLAAVAGTVCLTVAGLFMLRRRPLIGFGLLFFLVNLLPESVLVPQYLFLGYRAAAPMAGLLLVVADLAMIFPASIRDSSRRTALQAGLLGAYAAVILFMGWAATAKADLWTNPVAFWREVVERLPPDSQRIERHGTEQALIGLGMSLLQQGRPSKAVEVCRRLSAVNPASFSAAVLRGNAYTALGDFEQAELSFGKALDIDPESADAHVALGRLFMGKGRLPDAVSRFERALALAPENPTAQYEMGRALLAMGRHDKALPHLRRAVEGNRESHEAHYVLGKALMKAGDLRSALDSFRTTLEIKPDHWQSHNDIGVIWATIGKPDAAVAHFRKALAGNPEDVAAKRNLETALERIEQDRSGRRRD
ncbi:MAG: tetratricopeptide repeat protein [Pseudomonadota bacterium]